MTSDDIDRIVDQRSRIGPEVADALGIMLDDGDLVRLRIAVGRAVRAGVVEVLTGAADDLVERSKDCRALWDCGSVSGTWAMAYRRALNETETRIRALITPATQAPSEERTCGACGTPLGTRPAPVCGKCESTLRRPSHDE
jgi:hypothetical protein